MGWLEDRARRIVEKAKPVVKPHLESGEHVAQIAYGFEGPWPWRRVLGVGAILLALSVILAIQGYALSSWVIGGSIGLTFVSATIRQGRWVVLTDSRVLFFAAPAWRTRPGALLESHALERVRAIELRPSLGERRIRYRRPTGGELELRFPRLWSATADRMLASLSAPDSG